jgi:hypothetical protein
MGAMALVSNRWGKEPPEGGLWPTYETLYFAVAGDKQVKVTLESPDPGVKHTVAEWKLEDRKPWMFLDWDPSDAEQAAAIRVATRKLESTGAHIDLEKEYPISAAGRPVMRAQPARVHLAKGVRDFRVSSWGEHRVNRVVFLDFLDGENWVMRVAVDLDQEQVIPHSWKPTPEDIEQARKVADPSLGDFIKGDAKVGVRGWSDYYAPGQWVLVLCYTKARDESSSELRYVSVDMTAKQVWRSP